MPSITFQSIKHLFRDYGYIGTLWLAFDLARTRIWFRGVRLIRFPIYIRGQRWINFGNNFSTGRFARIEAFGNSSTVGKLIQFGRNVRINDNVHIGAVESVIIGDRVLIASKVYISDHNHGAYGKDGTHSDPTVPPFDRPIHSAPVVIEDDVWIGEFVSVLPGVRIGRGSVIGSMTTVTHDIPAYSIAVGSPARVIKQYIVDSGSWERV